MDKIHTIARALICDNNFFLLAFNGYNFFLPGGHVKYNEPLLYALEREIKEEVGLKVIHIGGFVGVVENVWDDKGVPFHEQCFIFEVTSPFLSSDKPVISRESHISFHWKKNSDLQNYNFLPSGMDEFLENYIKTREPRFHSFF